MKIILSSELPDVAGGAAPPEWMHLVPSGSFSGADGRGPYVLRDPHAVIAASMAGGKLPVDENHSTDYAMTTGGPAPARGWITEMQARPDGIWGRVEWNASGLNLMKEGAYRGFSPVLVLDAGDGKTVKKVLRGALTNTPNLGALTTLQAQRGNAGSDTLTAEERRIALKLGVDPEKMAALKSKTSSTDGPDLSDQELATCQKMNVHPKKFAAQKERDAVFENFMRTGYESPMPRTIGNMKM